MAELLLWPMIYAAAINGRPMADVLRWVMTQDRRKEGEAGEVAGLLEEEMASGDPLRRARAAAAMDNLSAIWDWDGDDRLSEPVYTEAEALLRPWQ